eukprot:2624819-Rhodomonas_salina.3
MGMVLYIKDRTRGEHVAEPSTSTEHRIASALDGRGSLRRAQSTWLRSMSGTGIQHVSTGHRLARS